ncbi:glycosyltransferase family 2 protein [Bacillus sp. 3255]|nr:glycosyltransferase family 2 protein [Bacillus sp. 3255]
MTIQAGDRFDATFLQELNEQLQRVSVNCAGVFVHPKHKSGSPEQSGKAPSVWRTAAVKQGGPACFSEIERLPFEQYVMYEKWIQLSEAWEWQHMLTEHWEPCATKAPSWKRSEEEWKAIKPILHAKSRVQHGTADPLISVVISTYNNAEYLPWAIRSVYTQSNAQWELLIVDDGSQDQTGEVLRSLERDSRIRFIENESNQGKAGCLNQALRQVRSRWLLELDADDWLAPDCLDVLTAQVQSASHSTALFHGNYYEWYERKPHQLLYSGVRNMPGLFDKQQFLTMGLPLVPRLYRVDALKQIGGWSQEDPSHGRLYEDFEVITRLSKDFSFRHIPTPLYHRRLRRFSITHQNYAHFSNWREWIEKQ